MVKLKMNTVLQAAGACLCALGLTLGLYLGGTGLGGLLLRLQKEYRIELFNRAVANQGVVARLISDEEVQTVTTRYLAAMMDAVIRFEFFPRQEDAETFFSIISALPSKVHIDKFEFSGRNLIIYCHASSETVLGQFHKNLEGVSQFDDVSLETYQKKDGSCIGTLTCIAA